MTVITSNEELREYLNRGKEPKKEENTNEDVCERCGARFWDQCECCPYRPS